MDRLSYTSTAVWWPPRLNSFWVRVIRPLRILRQRRRERLRQVEIYDLENLRRVVDRGDGVLIVSNHAANPDPYLLLAAGDRLGRPFFYLVAWQLLEIYGLLGRWTLRRHGCFSINREGNGLAGFRRAVEILRTSPHPLVLFPEGEIYHSNDHPAPFRTGAAAIALAAASKARRRIVCVPAAIQYWFLGDPLPRLNPLMDQLECRLFGAPRPGRPLAERVYHLAEEVVARKEVEYLGGARQGTLAGRTIALAETILGRLERDLGVVPEETTIPERVTNLRRLVVQRRDGAAPAEAGRRDAERDLEDLHVVAQLFSYSRDYLDAFTTLEHLGEVLDKFEEDVLDAPTATARADRRGAVLFGEPIEVGPTARTAADTVRLTATLESRVHDLLKEIRVRGEQGRHGPERLAWPVRHSAETHASPCPAFSATPIDLPTSPG